MKNGLLILKQKDKTLEVTTISDVINVTLEDPDYGDSYTGFGVTIMINLTEGQAEQLYIYLKGVLEL